VKIGKRKKNKRGNKIGNITEDNTTEVQPAK
jgi:hypothetical protein